MEKNLVSSVEFGRFFHTKAKSPIRYQTRAGANYYHDLVYISSYLHDAEFKLSFEFRGHPTYLLTIVEREIKCEAWLVWRALWYRVIRIM